MVCVVSFGDFETITKEVHQFPGVLPCHALQGLRMWSSPDGCLQVSRVGKTRHCQHRRQLLAADHLENVCCEVAHRSF